MNFIENKKTFGIGKNKIYNFKNEIGLNIRQETSFRKNKHYFKFLNLLENSVCGDKLKERNKENIYFLTKIRTVKGVRHRLNYPTRGQRTHTNAKTRKKTRS